MEFDATAYLGIEIYVDGGIGLSKKFTIGRNIDFFFPDSNPCNT